MVEQVRDATATNARPDGFSEGCAHHWQIETPAGESSQGRCKICGATRSFLNYSQRRTITRATKGATASQGR